MADSHIQQCIEWLDWYIRQYGRLRVPRTAERAEHDLLVDVVLLVARRRRARVHDG